jgi:hypothetical protein
MADSPAIAGVHGIFFARFPLRQIDIDGQNTRAKVTP